MKNLFNRFVNEEAGQDLIEYALLATFIAIVSITALRFLGAKVHKAMLPIDRAF